jgi:hypothetical protein
MSTPWFSVEMDGFGEQTIWLMRREDDPAPMAVLSLSDLNPSARHLWPTIARALLDTEVSA